MQEGVSPFPLFHLSVNIWHLKEPLSETAPLRRIRRGEGRGSPDRGASTAQDAQAGTSCTAGGTKGQGQSWYESVFYNK